MSELLFHDSVIKIKIENDDQVLLPPPSIFEVKINWQLFDEEAYWQALRENNNQRLDQILSVAIEKFPKKPK
jgi:hypothetical protein